MSATSNNRKNFNQVFRQMKHIEKWVEDDISVADVRLGYVLAEQLQDKMLEYYRDFLSSIPNNDPQDRTDTGFWIEHEIGGRYRVHATGSHVVYDEFGTGQLGLESPHPEKSRYALSDYNSGPNIKYDSTGRGYWIFKRVTYGVPAGAFVYQAVSDMGDQNYDNPKLKDEFVKIVKDGG